MGKPYISRSLAFLCLFFLLLATHAQGASINSNGTGGGNWSSAGTWTPAQVPTSADTVTILSGDTVTVNITTATASATTINGTISFSRVSSSSLTIVGGNVTVNSGGTLDMGTSASPIAAGVRAHLVLALGSSAGQFGLIVNNGGTFTVRGATKTPSTTATTSITPLSGTVFTVVDASGWSVGDTVTIGPTQGNGIGATEQRSIAAIAGNNVTMNAAAAAYHFSTGTIRVADLTSNVLVRSSGTVVQGAGGNSAYIQNLAQTPGSFSLQYGEFAYLGANITSKFGITFDGAGVLGFISSSTLRNGYDGVYFNAAPNNTLSGNLVYNNASQGIFVFFSNETTLISNDAYANDTGISISASQHILIRSNAVHSNGSCAGCGKSGIFTNSDANNISIVSNQVYSNADSGIGLCAGSNSGTVCLNTAAANNIYANGGQGIALSGTLSLLSANKIYLNTQNGIYFVFSATNTLVSNSVYSNGGDGISDWEGYGNLLVEDRLGFDAAGNSLPDGQEIGFVASSHRMRLQGERVNGGAPDITGFDRSGNSIISYNQDFATGTVRLWGDYLLAGSTVTLDYSTQLYASTATAPKLMFGTGHTATLCTTNDAKAISQLITIQRVAGVWQVTGSSSGAMGSIAPGGSCPGTAIPAGAAQFNLVLTQGGAPVDGDILDFVLIAASNDAAQQKKLLIGPAASGFNTGKSLLTVAPSGGLALTGISGNPTLMDMLPGGTYYTIIDSGAFTSNFSSITNTDSGGLQLSGSAGVSLSNTVFDFMGVATATNTYITARSLTSNATLSNITFNTSRPVTSPHAYNILVTGNDAGLAWTINAPASGPYWGQPFDFDLNNRITWGATNLPPSNPSIAGSQIFPSSVSVSYGLVGGNAYIIQASTASDFSGTLFTSSTTDNTINLLNVYGLNQNTTYYFRAGTLWGNATFYANTTPASAITLAVTPSPLNFTGIAALQFTVNWPANNNPNTTLYVVNVSTDLNFGIVIATAATTALTSTFSSGLSPNATYYVRVQAFNSAGKPSGYALGAVITVTGIITISANRLPGVWYNVASAVFFAQGATNYRYRLSAIPLDTPSGTDPLFDGSGLTLATLQGVQYFHVLGVGGAGNNQVAHFGPIDIDTGSPIMASISAQNNATDLTLIPNGGTTLATTPRFFWPAAGSASPIVGYSFSLSTDPAVSPSGGITTTITFTDQILGLSGLYYAKVSALNLAGSLGPPVSMSFTFTSTPSLDRIVLKHNYLNPVRGECTKLETDVASAGHLKIEIFNLLAERVSSISDQDVGPGVYNFSWCGRNSANQLVATGVYLLRVAAPNQKKNYSIVVEK